jgi:putative transposase
VANPEPLALGCLYHIYNRGTNRETLFHGRADYERFLLRYALDIGPVAETFTYCLMGNHFHLAIRTRTEDEQREWHAASLAAQGPRPEPFRFREPSDQFRNLFNAYAKWFNNRYERSGSLFEHPFDRKLVTSDAYFCRLVRYVHRNAQHHGVVEDFRTWPWSSYGAFLSTRATRVQRDVVLEMFGGTESFVNTHEADVDAEFPDEWRLE